MSKRIEFEFKLTYFDKEGKFRLTDKHVYAAVVDLLDLPIMQYVAAHIRGLRDNYGQNDPLPADWDGIIMIECKKRHPILVLPNVED